MKERRRYTSSALLGHVSMLIIHVCVLLRQGAAHISRQVFTEMKRQPNRPLSTAVLGRH
mgnify:CR=1 FL=1